MFEQHPVPQNISSYQFRLVGDMTLTQFFQLAGGALLGLLVYSLPIPGLFKWPLIVLLVLGGAAMAFLPIQERPLAMWLKAFIRSIYSPTVYVWERLPSYQFFIPEDQANIQALPEQPPAQEQKQVDLSSPAYVVNLEEGEKTMLGKISKLFSLGGTRPAKPRQVNASGATQQQADAAQATAVLTEVPTAKNTPDQEPTKIYTVPVKKEVVIPKQQAVKVEEQAKQESAANNNHVVVRAQEQKLNQTLPSNKQDQQAVSAKFSVNASPPTPPERENVVVGQVVDKSGKIIEGAILEIKDEQGRPVRALKTNKAGHFQIVTPLNNGKYFISTEKEGYNFDTIEIEAKGEKIEPIAIYAK